MSTGIANGQTQPPRQVATPPGQPPSRPRSSTTGILKLVVAILVTLTIAACGVSKASGSSDTRTDTVPKSSTASGAPATPSAATGSSAAGQSLYEGASQPRPLPNVPDNVVTELSCTSDGFCAFTDQQGNVWTLHGNEWHGPNPTGLTLTSGVVCATKTYCVAYGEEETSEEASIYNGVNWTIAPYPGSGALDSISCPSSKFCMAVDGDGYAATLNGATWSQPVAVVTTTESGPQSLDDVSCPNPTFCIALDSSGHSQRWENGSWTAAGMSVGPNALGDVPLLLSCPTTTFCAAVDGQGSAYTWNGTAWRVQPLAGSAELEAIDCPEAGLCAAVGGSGGVGNEAILANEVWTVHQGVSPSEQLDAVACATAQTCLAASVYGHVSKVTFHW